MTDRIRTELVWVPLTDPPELSMDVERAEFLLCSITSGNIVHAWRVGEMDDEGNDLPYRWETAVQERPVVMRSMTHWALINRPRINDA